MRISKNIQTEHEMELVKLLMAECQSTGEIQEKLKRLFAGTIEQSGYNIGVDLNIMDKKTFSYYSSIGTQSRNT